MLDLFVDTPALAAAIVAGLAVLIGALVIWLIARRRRSRKLERRFGAEYQRTVDDSNSRREGERQLDARRRERERIELHALRPGEREELRARFEDLQASFVDAPEEALRAAHHLVAEAAALRGYTPVDGMSRLELVSADHPDEVAVHERNLARLEGTERIGTEELRQSLLAARRLFETIVRVGEDEEPDAPRPPRTLLGLHDEEAEADGQDVEPTKRSQGRDATGESSASSDGPKTPDDARVVGEASARTISTRPDEGNGVGATRDLTRRTSRRRRAHR